MFKTIKGKKVLVTGGSTGIGAAIAEIFGAHGAWVGVHYRSREKEAEAVAERIRSRSGWGEVFQGDLLDVSVQQDLVGDFVEASGGIDVLVNNAGGVYDYVHFSQLDEQSWDKTFMLNAKAPFFLIRQAFPEMIKAGGGRIINISTISAKYGGSIYNMHYCSSKAALDTLTIGFAREGAKHNILVNSIRCGIIDTEMGKRIPGYSKERFNERISLVPLQRAGSPEEIARMALFLASEGGDFITGQILAVSGGD